MFYSLLHSKFISYLTLVLCLSFSHSVYANESDSDAKQKALDQELTNQIHDKIGSSFLYDKVNVETKKGTVTLTGIVKTTKDKEDVEKEARSVNGVKEVKNELKINTNKDG